MATILQIAKALEIFRPRTKTIKSGLIPEDADHELEKVSKQAKQFETTAEAIAEAASLKTDTTIVQMIKDGKLEILMHALDTQFAEKYKAQIRTYKTFEELKQFLQSVFGSTLTDEEKLNNARRLMENATRHAKDNEPFEVFHKRLQNIGLEITAKSTEAVTKIFIKDAFLRNLSPKLKNFLLEHGKNTEETVDMAKFLDQKRKHIFAVSTNNIEIGTILELTQQNADLQNQIAVLTQLVQTALHGDLTENRDVDVNKISTKPETRKNADSRQTAFRRPDWIYKSDGRPVRCLQCGLFGHNKQDCPRTCKAVCHGCGKIGHLKAVCRASKNV